MARKHAVRVILARKYDRQFGLAFTSAKINRFTRLRYSPLSLTFSALVSA